MMIGRVSIGTADTGGVYYILGGGIAKVISTNIPNTIATADVTPGAVDNVAHYDVIFKPLRYGYRRCRNHMKRKVRL